MRPRTVLIAVAVLVLAAVVGVALASRRRPPSGLVDGRLRPCPEAPSCACSQDEGEAHVAPLEVRGDPDEAFALLVGRLERRHELLRFEDVYAHFEVTSWFGFRSDLELLLDRPGRRIHVRAAARVGHTDLGASRRRVEALRRELAER